MADQGDNEPELLASMTETDIQEILRRQINEDKVILDNPARNNDANRLIYEKVQYLFNSNTTSILDECGFTLSARLRLFQQADQIHKIDVNQLQHIPVIMQTERTPSLRQLNSLTTHKVLDINEELSETQTNLLYLLSSSMNMARCFMDECNSKKILNTKIHSEYLNKHLKAKWQGRTLFTIGNVDINHIDNNNKERSTLGYSCELFLRMDMSKSMLLPHDIKKIISAEKADSKHKEREDRERRRDSERKRTTSPPGWGSDGN